MASGDLRVVHPPNAGSWRLGLAAWLFTGIAGLMATDLVGDSATGVDALHLSAEGLVMVLAITGVVVLWRGLVTARARVERLGQDLAAARVEADRYREEAHEALSGLGQAIDRQFERWNLTPAEREVALLLLKGLTHREVAGLRATGEATVRQQAQTVYRKSGLRSRSDLSAFFLEDLLLPFQSR